jgi:signal transduction histidine kinase
VRFVRPKTASLEWLPALARVASGFVIGLGSAVLLGWVLGIRSLILLLPTMVAMNPVTALLIILLGGALWRFSRGQPVDGWRFVLGSLVALAGVMKLADYVVGLPFHIDHVLFSGKMTLNGPYPPSEMSPNTAMCFFLCGTALVGSEVRTRRGLCPAQQMVLIAGLICLLALVGYSYRALLLYQVGTAIPMSLDAALALAAFCLGFLAARPNRGVMNLLTSLTTGGAMARRLLPMALLVPWGLGALLLLGERGGYYAPESVASIFAIASIIIFTGLLWWNAKLLYRADMERARSERRMAVQHNATRLLADSSNLAEVAPRILQVVCESLGWPAGGVWMVADQCQTIHCSYMWHAPSEALAAFAGACRERALPQGTGVPGRVWATGQPVLETNQAALNDAGLPAGVLAAAGVCAAFGFPIRLGGDIFGVMEFLSRTREPPEEMLVEVLNGVGSQIGQFIERTRAEEQLRQTTANLQRSNTDLQQFAYVASHDLTEPLRMVASYLQLLADRYGQKLEPQAKEFIGYAVDGAKRMQALIQDLLAYSRVDLRGRSLQPTDAEQVFQAAVFNLKVALEESGAAITHEPLPRVLSDSVQLTQVFQNLLGNAIKFRGAEPPRIHVRAEQRDNEWVFSVRDNGIGIDPKDFERLFIIFQRLHTRQEYEGTGMGLAICKKILERHGGRIWVESAPGKGTTFWFTLPVMKEA